MSASIVTCITCGKRGLAAKPTCSRCLPPAGAKAKPKAAPPLTEADQKYLALKAANGSSF